MEQASKNVWLAGVDGCRKGWMVTFMRPRGTVIRQRVLARFADIFLQPERPSIVVVDMPIGLPRFSPPQGRAAETIARSHLKIRRSSVFRVPSRSAVYAAANKIAVSNYKARYKKECAIARKTSADKKAFAKQGFYICPKIVEVDKFMRQQMRFRSRVYESHPELAFWRLNSKKPLPQAKKHPDGIRLRIKLLVGAGIPRAHAASKPPKGASFDDVLDSFVCAVIARRIRAKTAESFPDPAPRDEYGLPMAIWA